MKFFNLLLIFIIVIFALYLSWLPNPDLSTEIYLPLWLRNWSNYYYNLRTAVPFIAIGFLLEVNSYKNNFDAFDSYKFNVFAQNTAISILVICIAEVGQLFIENRHADFSDVFFGILGSIIGSLLYYILQYLIKLKRKHNAKYL